MKKIDLFHIGPQKTGSTWIYRCLKEHPEVLAPYKDTIHYFNVHYHRNRDWLRARYPDVCAGQRVLDPSYSYMRSPDVPARIYAENPSALIALSMRHPITRAFSHYWHEKKKCRYNFKFCELMENYDLFVNWLEPGFYASHIESYLEYFPPEQLLAQRFDVMAADPKKFLRDLFSFYGIDPEFSPSVLGTRVNVARPQESRERRRKRNALVYGVKQSLKRAGLGATLPYIGRFKKRYLVSRNEGSMETLGDYPPAFLDDLMARCLPEIERLERLLDIDLADWRSLERVA